LRSKKEFFDTVVHELAHITAFRKKFDRRERKILIDFINFLDLLNKYKFEKSNFLLEELRKKINKYYKKNEKLIDRYIN
jgi:predicted SprT family Zn-dependent metalloprotease